MQIIKSALNQYKKAFHVLFILVLLSVSFITVLPENVKAAPAVTGAPANTAELATIVANSDCPEAIKQAFLDIQSQNNFGTLPDVYSGTYFIARDESTGQIVGLTCSSAKKIQAMIIRIFVIIMSLVGFVLSFAIGKSAVLMITAFDDQEKFQAAIKSLTTAIGATVGVFFSYIIIVFIFVGLLGVGRNAANPEWSVFCQNRIVFSITFARGEDPCSVDAQLGP
jgi:hypothetical protein